MLEKELGVPHKADKFEKILKTGKYGINSVIEGAVSVGENVRDFVELHGTDLMGKGMMKVGFIDQEIYDEMMEETKANIAINYVKDSANIINENQGLTGNVYHEDTVRSIGNGIGKTAEIIGLSLAGGHIASAAGASTGAAATATTTATNTSKIATVGTKLTNAMTKSETYSRLSRWAIAGTSGAGEELQTAFQNGATIEEGKKASYIKGLWDSFQWMVGEGINNFNPLKGKITNSALHVGLDAVDGGAEGFVQPAIQKIYKDGTYSEIFNANGGWANVGVQALLGGGLSALGEISQNIKIKNNVDDVIKSKDTMQVEKINKKSKNVSNAYINSLGYKVKNAKYKTKIDGIEFVSETQEQLNSLVKYFQSSKTSVEKGYFDNIKKKYKNKIIVTNIDDSESYYDGGNIVNIGKETIENSAYSTFFHEIGHFLDRRNKKNIIYDPITPVIANDDINVKSNFKKFVNDYKKTEKEIEQFFNSNEGLKMIQEETIKKMNNKYGNGWSKNSLYVAEYQKLKLSVKDGLYDNYMRQSGYSSISDMFASLGFYFDGGYSHPEKYFSSGSESIKNWGTSDLSKPRAEIIAHLNTLYANDNFNILKKYFSNETVNDWETNIKKINGIKKSVTPKVRTQPSQNLSNYNSMANILKRKGFSDEEIISIFNSLSEKDLKDFVASGITADNIKNPLKNNVDFIRNKIINDANINDPELELASIGNSKTSFIKKIKQYTDKKQKSQEFYVGQLKNMTQAQKTYVQQVNDLLKNHSNVNIPCNNTSQLTVEMLKSIDDLSRVQIIFDGTFRDINGNYKTKYSKPKYNDRITYTGYEALSILTRLDQLQSMVDMSLPTRDRAHQICKILTNEYSYLTDFGNYVDGHKIAASFRGLTANNSIGKEGLVCAGFASAYKELCNRCGITCDYIRGTGIDNKGKTEPHAWNVIIDDNNEVIPVDVTWSSGSKELFGKSQEFADRHIADSDEYFKDYKPKVNIANYTDTNSNNIIENIVNTINQKYGQGAGISALENYFTTGNKNSITRTNNARAMLDQISLDDINNYLMINSPNYRNNQLRNIEYMMDQKYGYGQGKLRLIQYVKTRNPELITRTNNARQIIQTVPINDIINYIDGGYR